MTTVPAIRTKLRNISSKNKSLQDILPTLLKATKIESVTPVKSSIHNTILVCEVGKGEDIFPGKPIPKRIHAYNRLDLEQVLIGMVYTGTNVENIIEQLNLQGGDFNSDDLEIVDGVLKAKNISLGYFNKATDVPEPDNCFCVMDHLSLDFTDYTLAPKVNEDGALITVNKYVFELIVGNNDVVYAADIEPNTSISAAFNLLMTQNNLSSKIDLGFTGTDDMLLVTNLTPECSGFGLKIDAYTGNENDPTVLNIEDVQYVELCPNGERKLVCTGLSKSGIFNTNIETMHIFPVGEYTLFINNVKSSINAIEPITDNIKELIQQLQQKIYGYIYLNDNNGIMNVTDDCVQVKLEASVMVNGVLDKTEIFNVILGNNQQALPIPIAILYPPGTEIAIL